MKNIQSVLISGKDKFMQCVCNKSRRALYAFVVVLLSSLFVPLAMQTYAKTTEEKISEAEKAVKDQEKKIKDAQNKLESLEESKAQLEGSLAALNEKLGKVSDELTALEGDLDEKQLEIANKQVELDAAILEEEKQYDCMKKRIKYLYELGGDATMFQLLLDSGNFADMLNKADYFSQITAYDRQMLEQYQNTRNMIALTKQELEQDKADIELLIAQREEKQAQVQTLVDKTSKQIAKQSSNIEAAQEQALKYEKELDQQKNKVENLQAQLNYEKEIRAAEAKKNSAANSAGKTSSSAGGGSGNYNVLTSLNGYDKASSSSDLAIMAAIIYCEAGGEPYAGQLAVGSVIMNRIKSSYFPNTLLGVLYQKSQFTPVMSGRFAIVLSNGLATDQCYQAAQEVLSGRNTVPDCLFFRTVIDGIDGQIIGTQIFY